jgi:hypothetical protein
VKLTDEQNVALARAFLSAWHSYWAALDYEHPGVHVAEHAVPASEAAVSAFVELLERDYCIEAKPPRERAMDEREREALAAAGICPVHHTQLRWGQCVECGVDEDDS